jgi:hypothetical protein
MDGFALKPERKINKKSLIWNILTVIALLGVCCLAYYVLTVFLNPYSALNPFPPAAEPTRYATDTPTITMIQPDSTWTGTPTIELTSTRTKAPTWTLLPEMITPSKTEIPTETETPTITPTAGTPTVTATPMPAVAEVKYETSTTIHPDLACNWMGVGGKVIKASGDVLQFQTIQLGGTLDGQTISRMTLSGNAPAYGTSGFEFVLSDHPLASSQTLWIQLFDNNGKPLTDKIYFDTYDDCQQNLVRITFTKNR